MFDKLPMDLIVLIAQYLNGMDLASYYMALRSRYYSNQAKFRLINQNKKVSYQSLNVEQPFSVVSHLMMASMFLPEQRQRLQRHVRELEHNSQANIQIGIAKLIGFSVFSSAVMMLNKVDSTVLKMAMSFGIFSATVVSVYADTATYADCKSEMKKKKKSIEEISTILTLANPANVDTHEKLTKALNYSKHLALGGTFTFSDLINLVEAQDKSLPDYIDDDYNDMHSKILTEEQTLLKPFLPRLVFLPGYSVASVSQLCRKLLSIQLTLTVANICIPTITNTDEMCVILRELESVARADYAIKVISHWIDQGIIKNITDDDFVKMVTLIRRNHDCYMSPYGDHEEYDHWCRLVDDNEARFISYIMPFLSQRVTHRSIRPE